MWAVIHTGISCSGSYSPLQCIMSHNSGIPTAFHFTVKMRGAFTMSATKQPKTNSGTIIQISFFCQKAYHFRKFTENVSITFWVILRTWWHTNHPTAVELSHGNEMTFPRSYQLSKDATNCNLLISTSTNLPVLLCMIVPESVSKLKETTCMIVPESVSKSKETTCMIVPESVSKLKETTLWLYLCQWVSKRNDLYDCTCVSE